MCVRLGHGIAATVFTAQVCEESCALGGHALNRARAAHASMTISSVVHTVTSATTSITYTQCLSTTQHAPGRFSNCNLSLGLVTKHRAQTTARIAAARAGAPLLYAAVVRRAQLRVVRQGFDHRQQQSRSGALPGATEQALLYSAVFPHAAVPFVLANPACHARG
jgi:hypothetical protein